MSDPKIEHIKRNAREWVIQNKSWENAAQQYHNCYKNVYNSK